MSKEKYIEKIFALSKEIKEQGDIWELYYQRGYYYFLCDENDKSKEDYKQAVSFGMDVTQYPYYTFSNSNEKRRDFILTEKILVFLILIIVIIALAFQILTFVFKIKSII